MVIPASLPLESSGDLHCLKSNYSDSSAPKSFLAAPACSGEKSRAGTAKLSVLLLPGASAAVTCWERCLWCPWWALGLLSPLFQCGSTGCCCAFVRKEDFRKTDKHLFKHHLPEELLAKFPLCCLPAASFYCKKAQLSPQPCTGTALKFVSEKNSDETNAFDISVVALVSSAVEKACPGVAEVFVFGLFI